jgi:enoyl-CoA hydratase/carnithine racemase
MFENIKLEYDGVIATLTINRPDKMNAVNNATVEEFDAALAELEKNADVRVMILTGAGDKAFAAGADINELSRRDALLGRGETRRRQEVYTRIEMLEIPSIAVINGFALGTGLELAMACTLRVASTPSKLGQPEVNLGIIPGAGGTQRLPRLVGMGWAMEMILTAAPISADKALSIGLVNRVVAPEAVMEEAKKIATLIASKPKLAIQYGKEAVLRYNEGSFAQGMAHESYLHALACGTYDKKEGVTAFLEKRKPKFEGK